MPATLPGYTPCDTCPPLLIMGTPTSWTATCKVCTRRYASADLDQPTPADAATSDTPADAPEIPSWVIDQVRASFAPLYGKNVRVRGQQEAA